jgi:hypothetical protein
VTDDTPTELPEHDPLDSWHDALNATKLYGEPDWKVRLAAVRTLFQSRAPMGGSPLPTTPNKPKGTEYYADIDGRPAKLDAEDAEEASKEAERLRQAYESS